MATDPADSRPQARHGALMPKRSKHPRLRVHVKRGKAGQVWTSYWFDNRGTTRRPRSCARYGDGYDGIAPASALASQVTDVPK